MNLLSKRIGLLLSVAATALMLTACGEALTDSSSENSYLDDANPTPFVEFQSGSETDTASRERTTDPLDIQVGPNVSVNADISYEYEISSEEASDYADQTPNAPVVRTKPDSVANDVETDTLEVQFGNGSLTRSTRIVTVSLTSVSSDSEVRLGRNGTEYGRTRSYEVDPSIFVRTLTSGGNLAVSANLQQVVFDTTAVGGQGSTATPPLIANGSVMETDVESVSIQGPDASAFVLGGLLDPATGAPETTPVTLGTSLPGNLLLVNLAFVPTSAGEKSATLTFEMDNTADNTTVELPLSGVATN
jgi:hypothetical protein